MKTPFCPSHSEKSSDSPISGSGYYAAFPNVWTLSAPQFKKKGYKKPSMRTEYSYSIFTPGTRLSLAKVSRVLSRCQWSDYSIFITETRGISLWSYHPDRLLFRFCTANYRTFVRDCQDIFSTLFVSNAPKIWMHSICTRTPSSIIAPH